MAEVVVYRDERGKLAGYGEAGARAWARFQKMLARLAQGETLVFKWWEPRSPGFHKLFFSKLHALFERQERFDDVDKLRTWLTVGAGEADFMPGPRGRLVAIPKSIAWHKLDEADFRELVRKIDDFLWTHHAREFMWPQLSTEQTYEILEGLRGQFA